MVSAIPPKARETARLTYYTNGESEKAIKPSLFKSHIAEPSAASTLLQRNPPNTEDVQVKPRTLPIRTSGYTPGLYSGRGSEMTHEWKGPNSTSEAKLSQKKDYALSAGRPTVLCAKTVTKQDFSSADPAKSAGKIQVSENWLYKTRPAPVQKNSNKDVFGCSEEGPDWFKIRDSDLVKDHKIENSQGYDGTVTMLSKISGWVTVSPHSRNRQNRLGRYGPFDKSKKGYNFQNESDLAPAWMQTGFMRKEDTSYKNVVPPCNVRKEQKRVFLVEKEPAARSMFSYGDYRHDVMTTEEAKFYSSGLTEEPRRLIEWKEDPVKQRYDKPVTGKVGGLW